MPCETLATFLNWKGAKSCLAAMQEQISQSFFEIEIQNNINSSDCKSWRSFFLFSTPVELTCGIELVLR